MKLMMKLAIFLSIMLLSACSNLGTTRVTNGINILAIEDPEIFDTISWVDIFDYQTLANKKTKSAELAFQEANYDDIPKNGFIIVRLATSTIKSANTKFWRIVIKNKNGNVVAQETGPNKVANFRRTSDITPWVNSFLVLLPELEYPYEVYIISDILDKRWGFKVLGKQDGI